MALSSWETLGMGTADFWPRLRLWLANGMIVALLAIVLCDAIPFAPDTCQTMAVLIANRLGIGQGSWTMFSPPDSVNHRFRWELTFRDGTTLLEESPELTQQSVWQRFVGHRRSEYLDNAIVFGQQYPEIWQAMADRLVRQHAQEGGGVVRIRIIVQLSSIPPPSGDVWRTKALELPFDDERVVFRRKYP